MDRPRELGLLLVEVALRIVGEELREDQQRIQWRAKLVTHVREEFGFVFGGERKLLGLLLDRAPRHLDLDILRLDLLLLIFERSEEHTSELQSIMRIPYAVFCLKKTIHTHCTLLLS